MNHFHIGEMLEMGLGLLLLALFSLGLKTKETFLLFAEFKKKTALWLIGLF